MAELPEGNDLPFPSPDDHLGAAGWRDLIDEARTGNVAFPGGELRIVPTPAMTLIDVDGTLPAPELALAGAKAAARTIRRHGIGGSIGIDFPTVKGKDERQAVAEAVDSALPQPFERTAVNGFGFLQIVRPRRHASLIELAQDRACIRGAGTAEARGVRARRSQAPRRTSRCRGGARGAPRLARSARSPAGRRNHLAGRSRASHFGRVCRKLLKPSAARSAASRSRPNTRPSAAPAARTATC